MNSLVQRSFRFLPRLIRLLPPALNLLPKPMEAALYWLSVLVLSVTSLCATWYPHSKYPAFYDQLSSKPIYNDPIFISPDVAFLLALPGLIVFTLSQVLSNTHRPWLLVMMLVASHFVAGSLALVLLGVILALGLRRRSSRQTDPN